MKRILALLGVVLIIFLIWFAGPYVGLETIEARSYATIVFFLIVAVIALLKFIKASRVASFIENLIKRQADDQLINARPDQKENIEAVRNQFLKSIDILKKSKLGRGHRGSTALYELPWYIIIGPPATGKSTLLRHSGLNFPLTDNKIQGVGGTRNCDWWFANDGIILDTAGRYTVETEDKEEWTVFLDILKKTRKNQPINGVIVAISIADLINGSDEEIEDYAIRIKDRCDELLDKLKIKFPIYLMFTKCDLMDGFIDFFGDLTKSEREQVWGCTLTDEQRNAADIAGLFRTEMDKLTRSLYCRRLSCLSKERKLEKRERIFLFPLQYSNAREKIIRFVSCLFQPNPYRENPVLRGFYFTCGTQEGSPIDKILGRINPTYSDEEKKSYFIKDCFTKIIFPDQNFAQFTDVAKRTRRMTFVGSIILSAILAGGLISGISISYHNNSKLATRLQTDAKNVAEIKWDRRMEFQPNLTTLHNLREDIVMLENYQQDAPSLSLRFGLYEGTDFIDILRKIYLSKLNEIMVIPLKEEIEKNLKINIDSPVAEWDSLYNTLKAYLMLSMPDKLDQKFLTEQVSPVWENYLSRVYGEQKGYETNKIARLQLSFYLSQLSKNNVENNFILKSDPEIIRKTRALLNKEPAVKNIYTQIKKTGREQMSPLRLKDILPPESRDLLMTTYEVPGIFTKYGYDLYIKDAISKAGAITTSGDWVLGSIGQQSTESKEKQKKITGELNQLYVNEYLGIWNKFIANISVKPFNSIDNLVRGLNIFSVEHSSPLVLLVKAMTDNMQIEIDSYQKAKAAEAAGEIFDKVKRKITTKIGLTKTKLDKKEEHKEDPLGKEYFHLSRFSGKSPKADDKISGQEKYLETIRKLHEKLYTIALGDSSGRGIESFTRKLFTQDSLSLGSNELIDGIKTTNYILDDLKARSKDSIKRLFLNVFEQAGSFCIKATSERLNKLWEEKIYKAYKRDIAGKYPFAVNAGDDIPRSEVANFLKPESGVIWAFYDKELRSYLYQDDNSFVPKRWRSFGVPFTNDFLNFLKQAVILKDALFWKDKRTPKVKFWIRPHPPKSDSIYISKTIFHINGQRLVYENGPEVWEPFSWPGDKLEQEGLTPGASLEITRGVAGYKAEKIFQGEWSFFRLLDQAKPKTENKKFFKLRWDFQMEGEHVKVEVDLKTESSKNPFIPGIFLKFSCPEQLAAL